MNASVELISDMDKNEFNTTYYMQLSYSIFEKINEKIQGKCGNQRALLSWLIAQKQNSGFCPAESTILKACCMSHAAYVKARAELHEKGLIEYVPFKYIKINYAKLMED